MTIKNKTISKHDLRSIIKEEVTRLLKEEEYDYYRDYKAGTITRDEYLQLVKDFQRSSYPQYTRKTSYVGADANQAQIAAVEAALEKKPNNFLTSILSQLQAGRGLSAKQKGIVKKILQKVSPDLVSLFEGKSVKKPVVNESWMKIINE
jgi:hypothetical protein